MRFVNDTNTVLSLKDDYGKIKNEQILICSKSGGGKTLSAEGVAEKFHKNGYIVLCISDVKNEFELAFQMFTPREKYHLEHLRKIGKEPQAKKVKIYHPFTFNIPKGIFFPEINFYTLPLKDLNRKEWSILAETSYDTETMRLLLQASQNISNEDGLYGFLHYIQGSIEGKRVHKSRKPDPKNFYLKAGAGTLKALAEISNYLQPFKRDYFLTKENCQLNLDWKSILTDQENYHVFTCYWIRDEKLRDFTVLALIEGIIKNKHYLKKPVVIIIPEIRKLCPFRPIGHKLFLSESIRDSLSLIRSSGRGMSSILDSQVWSDISEEVRDSATETFFGELGGGGDMEKVAKAFNYKRDIRDQLKKMDYPYSFLRVGHEDINGVTFLFPSGMHKEPEYNFFEMYKQEYPEKMKKYDNIIELMKSMFNDEEKRIKEKVDKIEKEEKERLEKIKKEKEKSNRKDGEIEEKEEKIQKLIGEKKEELMKRCWAIKQENPKKSLREIGKETGLNHITVKKYITEYEEKFAKKDFADELTEETNEEPEEIEAGEDLELPQE